MPDGEPTHVPVPVPVPVNDLRYLYYALQAAMNGPANDDAIVPLLLAEHRALALLSNLLGIDPPWSATEAMMAPVAELPTPGSVEHNPLLPVPIPISARDGQPGLEAVVYGVAQRFDSFAFLDASNAEALVDKVNTLYGCATLGDLREVLRDLVHAHAPIHIDEDEYPFLPDTEPIDLADCEDWPPMPTQYALDLLPRAVRADLAEHADAEEIWTTLNGNYLHVPLDREAEMLTVLARHGIAARRDDDMIAELG